MKEIILKRRNNAEKRFLSFDRAPLSGSDWRWRASFVFIFDESLYHIPEKYLCKHMSRKTVGVASISFMINEHTKFVSIIQ